jgi:hypothetical protein
VRTQGDRQVVHIFALVIFGRQEHGEVPHNVFFGYGLGRVLIGGQRPLSGVNGHQANLGDCQLMDPKPTQTGALLEDGHRSSNCLSAVQASFTTVVQSPISDCLNSLAVGYQGVSLRPTNHRQSDTTGNSTQTGLPNAPARLTMDVSLEITRSKDIIIAAVS